jgi:hypothetical protein
MNPVSEAECQRSTRIAGTKGELIGNMDSFVRVTTLDYKLIITDQPDRL